MFLPGFNGMEEKIRSSGSHKSTNEIVFRLITDNLKIPSKILDFGAGSGYMCEKLAHHIASLGRVNPETCLSACDIFPEAYKYDPIKCIKVERTNSTLPFDSASFNLAYGIEVLEHLRRPYEFFERYFEFCNQGGKLYLRFLIHFTLYLAFLFFLMVSTTCICRLHLKSKILIVYVGILCR